MEPGRSNNPNPMTSDPRPVIHTGAQPASIQMVDIPRDARNQYHFTASGVLGSMHIATGVSSMAVMAGSIVAKAELYDVGHGIWCGVPFIVAGAFGLILGLRRTYINWVITAFLFLSAIAGLFAFLQVILACYCLYATHHYRPGRFDYATADFGERVLIHSLLLGVGLVEMGCSTASLYICLNYVRGRYQADTFHTYGVLHNAHYQTGSTPVGSQQQLHHPHHHHQPHQAGGPGVVFFTLPSPLYPSHGASPAPVFTETQPGQQQDDIHVGT